MAHIVPSGAPNTLIPILVLIELIRNIIRPITLSVRLSANIIAGHLLISLLGETSSLASLPLTFTMIIMLLVLEIAVALIQAYVFTILISIYSSEV
jgi:F-type H+-transporting ATPase subunit a